MHCLSLSVLGGGESSEKSVEAYDAARLVHFLRANHATRTFDRLSKDGNDRTRREDCDKEDDKGLVTVKRKEKIDDDDGGMVLTRTRGNVPKSHQSILAIKGARSRYERYESHTSLPLVARDRQTDGQSRLSIAVDCPQNSTRTPPPPVIMHACMDLVS